MMIQQQTNTRRERGQALAEFSLVLPILLMVVFGIFDFGRVIFVYSDASGSLRDAARNAEILGLIGGEPTYVACNTILGEAYSTRFTINEVADVYYYDTSDPDESGLTAIDPTLTGDAFLNQAHYSCRGGATLGGTIASPVITVVDDDGKQLSNSDFMRVHYEARIQFFTPFLSSLVSGLNLDFYAQRSIVVKLTLGSTGGIDYDYDGLDDRWEFMWYGCISQTDGTILKVHADHLFKPLDTWTTWTLEDGSNWSTAGNCDIRSVEYPANSGTFVDIPKEVNTDAVNATVDTDLDGCNNGCEETRNTQPYDLPGDPGWDTDGDGLSDGDEANIYSTNPSGGDLYSCSADPNVGRVDTGTYPSDGVPDGYDTDCDGVPDGVEVGVIDPYPNIIRPEEIDPGNPYNPSEARYIDNNPVDGNFTDGIDTDNDGLTDHEEYYIVGDYGGTTYDLCTGWDGINQPVEATPYQCLVTIGTVPNFPTNEYLTDPSNGDSDGDGISDGDEINGYQLVGISYTIDYGNGTTVTMNEPIFTSDPSDSDTDNDGRSDGEELTQPVYGGLGYTDPNNPDTDNDGVNDGDEENGTTNAIDADTDDDGLKDGLELNLASQPVPAWIVVDPDGGNLPYAYKGNSNPLHSNSDESGTPGYDSNNAGGSPATTPACQLLDGYEYGAGLDPTYWDTDDDGVSDCDELNTYGTNPTFNGWDTDDDGYDDGVEIAAGGGGLATDGTRNPDTPGISPTDSDSDGMADWWELQYFGDLTHNGAADDDGDGCDDLCEYQQGSSPSYIALDGDNISCSFTAATNTRVVGPGTDGQHDGYDTDCDGIPDGAELPASSPTNEDTDGDGLYDGAEGANYTYAGGPSTVTVDPRIWDSDGDGRSDGDEFNNAATGYPSCFTNAANPDTDGDGLGDRVETNPGDYPGLFSTAYNTWLLSNPTTTNPCDATTDDDLWEDGDEILYWSNQGGIADPTNADTDGDGIRDHVDSSDTNPALPYVAYTKWYDADTDGDGVVDGDEYVNLLEIDTRGGVLDGFTMTINRCAADGGPYTITINSGMDVNYYDSDGDGLSDGDDEVHRDGPYLGINPTTQFTDADGENDFDDATPACDNVAPPPTPDPACPALDPLLHSDCDGLPDSEETGGILTVNFGTVYPDETDDDTDDDGLDDKEEIDGQTVSYTVVGSTAFSETVATNPMEPDSDDDGLDDNAEVSGATFVATVTCGSQTAGATSAVTVTNPIIADTDGDGIYDGYEMAVGVNPLNASCSPSPLVKAKTSDDNLDTMLDYYWRVHADTSAMTAREAEEYAIEFIDGMSYVTTLNGLAPGDPYPEDLILLVAFTTEDRCPPPASRPNLQTLVFDGLGLTALSLTEQAGTRDCYWTLEVTIEQLIIISLNANVTIVVNGTGGF